MSASYDGADWTAAYRNETLTVASNSTGERIIVKARRIANAHGVHIDPVIADLLRYRMIRDGKERRSDRFPEEDF